MDGEPVVLFGEFLLILRGREGRWARVPGRGLGGCLSSITQLPFAPDSRPVENSTNYVGAVASGVGLVNRTEEDQHGNHVLVWAFREKVRWCLGFGTCSEHPVIAVTESLLESMEWRVVVTRSR